MEHIPFFERVKTDMTPHAETWIDESETIFITGEAAHQMPVSPPSFNLPAPFIPEVEPVGCQTCAFTAAAIMLEEASFLGALFSHLTRRNQISSFLYAFEDIRQPRALRLHELEADNLTILQLPPGPARDARNHTWAEEKKANVNKNVGQVRGGSSGGSGEDDHNSEAEEMELRRQWQGFFENWGYDGRDAAEGWWHEWGMLAQRALQSQDDASAQNDSNPWGQVNGAGLQFGQVDVVVSED